MATLFTIFILFAENSDRPCVLVVRVPGYRSRGPGSITGATRDSTPTTHGYNSKVISLNVCNCTGQF
jgi:hypothetical protein